MPELDDFTGFLAAAEKAADAAGAAIRPFFRGTLTAETKDDLSPVTRADKDAEQAIRATISLRYPEHGMWGEEFGRKRADARYCWVVDPIDGTRAFITGRPVFGTLIALLDEGVPVLGVIDQPITGERWLGVRGRETVFRARFGGRPGVRPCPLLGEAELSCTDPAMFDAASRARWDGLRAQVRRASWGGDCYAYGLLALGQIDVIAEAGMKVWDWAALVPVIQGAGGSITDWSGAALRADSDGSVLAVGDARLLAPAVAALAV